jgi:prepilin-type N-terminal cleavage/methylation domain-containing protein
MMKDDGVALIEMLVVVSVIAFLIVLAGISYEGWTARYTVENDIKQLYADTMFARLRAMERNRLHFLSFPTAQPTQYAIYEDTNTAPDGDGSLVTASDTMILQRSVKNTIVPALTPIATQFSFDKSGLASNTGTIRLSSTLTPDYDCIRLSETRINLGKWDGSACTIK